MTSSALGPIPTRKRDPGEPLRRYRIGAVEVYPLLQFHYFMDPLRLFPFSAEEPIDPNTWCFDPPYMNDGWMTIDIGGFLIVAGDHKLLVDLGVGNDKPRPNPHFVDRDDAWLPRLAEAGVTPDEISTVIFTHLHVDHVGYATTAAGPDEWRPTFSQAQHLTTQAELEHWTGSDAAGDARLGNYIADTITPLQQAGLLRLVEPDYEVAPGIRLVPAAGHTPGNVCVEVASQGERAIFTGDMIHHAMQLVRPEWSTDFCSSPAGAASAREAVLRDAASTGAVLFPGHFPDLVPGTVRVASDSADGSGGYTYPPLPGEVVSN